MLATIFDEGGVVLFGRDAYKYGLDKVYVIRGFEESKLENLSLVTEVIQLERIINARAKTTARVADVSNHCINGYWHDDKFHRLVADYTLNQPLGSNVGPSFFNRVTASAKHQRRRLGIWWADAISSLTFKVSGSYAGGSIAFRPQTQLNENNIPFEKDLGFGGLPSSLVNWLVVEAEGICKDNEPRTCLVNY